MSESNEVRDLEGVYDEQISPLVAQIIAICREHDMPHVMAFEYAPEALCTSMRLRPEVCDDLRRAGMLVSPKRAASPLHLTTYNADGQVTRMETIL